MPDLSLCRLAEGELAEAYPLIRWATAVTAERWTSFAHALMAAGGGALAVRADDGCLHGIAVFRPLDSLRHEHCLYVELLVTFELTGRSCVHRLLCSALDEVARELSCPSILLALPAARRASRTPWREPGLRLDAIGFVRSTAPKPPDASSVGAGLAI